MKEKLTDKETAFFINLLNKIRPKLSYHIANPHSVDMYWDDKCNVDNGIMGMFNWIKPNEISLNPDGKHSMEQMASTVAHELHHKWQYSHYGPLYLLALTPVIRQILLERTAKKLELEVDRIVGENIDDEDFYFRR